MASSHHGSRRMLRKRSFTTTKSANVLEAASKTFGMCARLPSCGYWWNHVAVSGFMWNHVELCGKVLVHVDVF